MVCFSSNLYFLVPSNSNCWCWYRLHKTNTSPLKNRPSIVFQPSIFRCQLFVSGRDSTTATSPFPVDKLRGLTYRDPKRQDLAFQSDWLDSLAWTRVKCSEDVLRNGCMSLEPFVFRWRGRGILGIEWLGIWTWTKLLDFRGHNIEVKMKQKTINRSHITNTHSSLNWHWSTSWEIKSTPSHNHQHYL